MGNILAQRDGIFYVDRVAVTAGNIFKLLAVDRYPEVCDYRV